MINLKQQFGRIWKTGYFYLISAMVVSQGFAFAQKILVSRWLSNEEFGRFSLMVETNVLMATLMTLALPTSMMRFGLLEGRLKEFVAGTIRIFLILSFLLLIVFQLIALNWQVFSDNITADLIRYTVLLAPFLAFFNYIVCYLTAERNIVGRSIIVILQRVFYFLTVAGGCWLGAWLGTIFGYSIFMICFGLLLYSLFYKVVHTKTWNFPYKELLTFSAWSSIGRAGEAFSFFIVLFFTEWLLADLASISQLTIAFAFTIIAKISFASITDVVYPYFVSKKQNSDFTKLLVKVLTLSIILSGIILAVSYGIVPFLIRLLLGERYVTAIPVFKIAIIGEIIVGFALILEMTLEILGAVQFKAISMVFATIALLLALPLFLQHYGLLGAVYAYLVFAGIRIIFNVFGVVRYLILYPLCFRSS